MKKISLIVYCAFLLFVFSLAFASGHEIYYDNHRHFNTIGLNNYYSYPYHDRYIYYSPKISSSTFDRYSIRVAPYFSSSDYFSHSYIHTSYPRRTIKLSKI